MDYNYTITLDKNRVIQTLVDQGNFLNGAITGDLLVTDTPIENKTVDNLKLIPQRHAAKYYSLHFLKEQSWIEANPNGFENTMISTVKFDGDLHDVQKLAVAPERYSLDSNSFQDFIDNNDGISLIVDYSKKVAESESWKQSSLLKNPLIPKYELSASQLENVDYLLDAIAKTNGSTNTIAEVIRQKGIESLFTLKQSVELKLAYQYSQGRVIEIPQRIHEGAKFKNNEALTRLTDSYMAYKAAMKREGLNAKFSDFYETNKDSINTQLETAVELQINLDMEAAGGVGFDDSEYIEEMAVKLYKQLNPQNELMGLEYHLGLIEDAYKYEYIPDRDALDLQLELLMDRQGEEHNFDKWLLNRISALELKPYLENAGEKTLYDEKGGLESELFYASASNLPISELAASLVTASNRDIEKITEYVTSDTVSTSKYASETYSQIINDFTNLSIELAEEQGVDIEESNQIVFRNLNGYLRSGTPMQLGQGKAQLEERLISLAELVSSSPITPPDNDGTQRLSLRDVKAIILPEADSELEKVDQMLAVEKLNERGFKGQTLIYDRNEVDGKAQAVHNFVSNNAEVTQQVPKSQRESVGERSIENEHLTIEQATRILDEIVASNPYLNITAHNTPRTLQHLNEKLAQKVDRLAGVAFDNSMHIVLSHELNQNERTLREVVAHESVHLGLRKMMNIAEYAELMEKVWKTIPESEKAELQGVYSHLNPNKTTDKRALAEEWLAIRGEEIYESIDPVVTESIKEKIKTFQSSIMDRFLIKGKDNQFDRVVKNAIRKAGQYNSIINGKVENGVIIRTAGEFTHQSRSSDYFRNFKENQSSGLSHSSEVLLAAKKDFIHKYGVGSEERYLDIKFDSVEDFSLVGSQLIIPKQASVEDCLAAVRTITESITEQKVEHESTNVSTPAEVKKELGKIDTSIKPATSEVEQKILDALGQKAKKSSNEQTREVSINNVEYDIDFGMR